MINLKQPTKTLIERHFEATVLPTANTGIASGAQIVKIYFNWFIGAIVGEIITLSLDCKVDVAVV